jgi:K+-sensing histidine kinase KdpD
MNVRRLAALESILAFVAFDWFFVPPLHELAISDAASM